MDMFLCVECICILIWEPEDRIVVRLCFSVTFLRNMLPEFGNLFEKFSNSKHFKLGCRCVVNVSRTP